MDRISDNQRLDQYFRQRAAHPSGRKTRTHNVANGAIDGNGRLDLKLLLAIDDEVASVAQDEGEVRDRDGFTPLLRAAYDGRDNEVKNLLARGAQLEAPGPMGRTPLHLAAMRGHRGVVSLLLGAGASKEARDLEGCTPIALSARHGHGEIVELLEAAGANPDVRDESHRSVSLNAGPEGPLPADPKLRKLLAIEEPSEQDEEVEEEDPYRGTPLHLAAADGDAEAVSALLNAEFMTDVRDGEGYTALHIAALHGHEGPVTMLLQKGADQTIRERNQSWTALHLAAIEGHVELFPLFKNVLETPDDRGQTPLHLAVDGNDPGNNRIRGAIDELIKLRANREATDDQGMTPLHVAAQAGRREAVAALCEGGAKLEAKDKQGLTPLALAILNRQWHVVDELVEQGADKEVAKRLVAPILNAKDSQHRTPLMLAASAGNRAEVKRLLEWGADPAIEWVAGMTVLHMVISKGYSHLIEPLVAADRDILRTMGGAGPLHLAIRTKQPICLPKLIRLGADLDRKDSQGRTPVLAAVALGQMEAVRLLLQARGKGE
jgi:ankyrin repeat protein